MWVSEGVLHDDNDNDDTYMTLKGRPDLQPPSAQKTHLAHTVVFTNLQTHFMNTWNKGACQRRSHTREQPS